MKKGFTLVELLAVIGILGLIGLITIPVVTNTLNKSKKDLYEAQLSSIKDAAKVWGVDNLDSMPEKENDSIVVTLGMLKDAGLVDEDLKDPRTKEVFDDDNTCVVVTMTSKGYKYDVSFDNDCKTN